MIDPPNDIVPLPSRFGAECYLMVTEDISFTSYQDDVDDSNTKYVVSSPQNIGLKRFVIVRVN